jgi:hypothetical protein
MGGGATLTPRVAGVLQLGGPPRVRVNPKRMVSSLCPRPVRVEGGRPTTGGLGHLPEKALEGGA